MRFEKIATSRRSATSLDQTPSPRSGTVPVTSSSTCPSRRPRDLCSEVRAILAKMQRPAITVFATPDRDNAACEAEATHERIKSKTVELQQLAK
jgi:hypothetical protein